MFKNDTLGDCVIAGRAHQTLRFELVEQEKLIRISDTDVVREYYQETHGRDTGLVVLESLKSWRRKGWKIGKSVFRIEAFSELNHTEHVEIQQAVVLDIGVGLGLLLPKSAEEQFDEKEPWDVVDGRRGKVNSWGGHYVYVCGYSSKGLTCVTWGSKQTMTWAFVDKYCDEAYAIIDALNTAKLKKAIDANRLTAFLSQH